MEVSFWNNLEHIGTIWNILERFTHWKYVSFYDKEEFDFWDNQFRKGLSSTEAYQDKIHDRSINQIGRQKAKSGLYKDSREACYPYRVDGINERY